MPSITINGAPVNAPEIINGSWLKTAVDAPLAHEAARLKRDGENRWPEIANDDDYLVHDGDIFVVHPRAGASA